jgi:hypothetical protein
MAEQRGIPEAKAEEIVKSMRSANQYQVSPLIFSTYPCPVSRPPGVARELSHQTDADISTSHRKTSGRRLTIQICKRISYLSIEPPHNTHYLRHLYRNTHSPVAPSSRHESLSVGRRIPYSNHSPNGTSTGLGKGILHLCYLLLALLEKEEGRGCHRS